MEVEAGQHAQFERFRVGGRQVGRKSAAGAGTRLRSAGREHVAGREFASREPAESTERISRAAAQDRRHVDPAGDRDVDAGARPHEIEAEPIVRAHREGFVARLRLAVELRRRFRPGDSDDGGLAEEKLGPEQGRFQHRRARVIADEEIGRAQAVLIEPPRDRNADVVIAGPAGVLHAGSEARLDHLNGHGAPPRDAGCSRRDRHEKP